MMRLDYIMSVTQHSEAIPNTNHGFWPFTVCINPHNQLELVAWGIRLHKLQIMWIPIKMTKFAIQQ